LCDKLETDLKLKKNPDIITQNLGGQISSFIISEESEYPYFAEKEENFLTIQVEIKNKKNLQEALDLYVKEEILEGENKYFCEKYNQHIKV
jgi:ubiquitin C-terminal hydrolase